MDLGIGSLKRDYLSVPVDKAVLAFTRASYLSGNAVGDVVFNIKAYSRIFHELQFYYNSIIEFRHCLIFCGYSHNGTYDTDLFHVLISEAYLLEYIDSCFFEPPYVVRVMYHAHLIRLVVLYRVLIRFNVLHLILLFMNLLSAQQVRQRFHYGCQVIYGLIKSLKINIIKVVHGIADILRILRYKLIYVGDHVIYTG